ncbi:transcriptional regulator/sugar kinase [Mycobacteroides abscessus subsp. abscessus]|nr:transcriptional regulator/sugar kinase [Mycobacteroides abscessus subsp. abscessus]
MRNYAAFDVGGSSIKYALMDEAGSIIKKSSIPTPKEGIEAFIEAIGNAVEDLRFISPVEGIAMSMPGAVDVASGTIHGASAVPYVHGPNIRELVERRTGLPAELENDANCAGLAEGWIGAAKEWSELPWRRVRLYDHGGLFRGSFRKKLERSWRHWGIGQYCSSQKRFGS